MQAKVNHDYLQVISAVKCEGQSIVTVPCADYDAYKTLPTAIEFENKIHILTGWNSDMECACYKTGVLAARIVKCAIIA
jgi:hypothetical protein